MIIGIDPGNTGALALISDDGEFIESYEMPLMAHGKKNQVNPAALAELLTNWQFMAMEDGEITAEPKNPESHKVRRGKVGGYKDYLLERDIAYLNSEIKHMPEEWRYE